MKLNLYGFPVPDADETGFGVLIFNGPPTTDTAHAPPINAVTEGLEITHGLVPCSTATELFLTSAKIEVFVDSIKAETEVFPALNVPEIAKTEPANW